MKVFSVLALLALFACQSTPEQRLQRMINIQVEEDKKANDFVSLEESKNNFGNAESEFNLGPMVEFHDALFLGKDDEYIARELSKYRFIKSAEDMIKARRRILGYYTQSGRYHLTEELVDCSKDHITIKPIPNGSRVAMLNDVRSADLVTVEADTPQVLQDHYKTSRETFISMARAQKRPIHVFFHIVDSRMRMQVCEMDFHGP